MVEHEAGTMLTKVASLEEANMMGKGRCVARAKEKVRCAGKKILRERKRQVGEIGSKSDCVPLLLGAC